MRPRALFHRARRAGMQLRAEFILPTTPSSNNNLVFHSGNWRGGGERRKEKLGLHTQQTTHCALRTAHPHPTYRIVGGGPTPVHFPVECSVDLSHPAFGRVAQEIITNIITSHVSSTLACHHRKQQQREREQPPRGRAGRPTQGDSGHHVRSYRAAPRSPCWEYKSTKLNTA